MQARPPPENVILDIECESCSDHIIDNLPFTYIPEYIPGNCSFAMPLDLQVYKSPSFSSSFNFRASHLSGFHSSASSPQVSLLLLAPRIEIITLVLAFNGISDTGLPSVARYPGMGWSNGRTMSLRVLNPKYIILLVTWTSDT